MQPDLINTLKFWGGGGHYRNLWYGVQLKVSDPDKFKKYVCLKYVDLFNSHKHTIIISVYSNIFAPLHQNWQANQFNFMIGAPYDRFTISVKNTQQNRSLVLNHIEFLEKIPLSRELLENTDPTCSKEPIREKNP